MLMYTMFSFYMYCSGKASLYVNIVSIQRRETRIVKRRKNTCFSCLIFLLCSLGGFFPLCRQTHFKKTFFLASIILKGSKERVKNVLNFKCIIKLIEHFSDSQFLNLINSSGIYSSRRFL